MQVAQRIYTPFGEKMKIYIYDTNYKRVFEIAQKNNCTVLLKGDDFEVRGKKFDVFRFKEAYNTARSGRSLKEIK